MAPEGPGQEYRAKDEYIKAEGLDMMSTGIYMQWEAFKVRWVTKEGVGS